MEVDEVVKVVEIMIELVKIVLVKKVVDVEVKVVL